MKKTNLRVENKIAQNYNSNNANNNYTQQRDNSEMHYLMLDSDYNYHLDVTKREYYENEDYEIIEDKIFFLKITIS
ncbi:MAG TPA: hypothetical protein LFW20_04800 [Rickettsia endosymbiont of Omalisus fontisbellaquei]|nr:hypothetical protein [Rickettsia endosymbiont of Omalisus fontisbellaquei]